MKLTTIALISPVLLTVACGESPVQRALVVDGPQTAAFEADRQHCIHLATTYDDGSAKDEAIAGAVVGGLIGAVEDDWEGAIVGAALGGALGNLEGSEELDDERRDVLIRCMQNRGHPVIG